MPKSSKRRLCNRCRSIVTGSCPTCDVGWTARPTKRSVATSDWRWRKLRARTLAEEPTCRACGIAASTDCDHIVPVAEGGAELDRANTQGLCSPCHKAKTQRES